MKKIYLFAFVLLFLNFGCSFIASKKLDPKMRQANKLVKKGNRHFKSENYQLALLKYEQALLLDSSNARALMNAGASNLMLFSNKKSLTYLQKAYRLNPDLDPSFHYWLGRSYQANMMPEKAIAEYDAYLQQLPFDSPERDEVAKRVTQARYAKIYYSNPTDHYVKNLGDQINSSESDYSSVLTGDNKTMIFTSRRTENKKGEVVTSRGDAFEKVYTASQFFDGSWGKPKALDKNRINKPRQHTSSVQLFDHDKKLLLYKSTRFGSLLASERTGNEWSAPVALNKFTNTSDYESSGFVTEKDSSIYFSSSRGSKDGNLDIYITRKVAGNEWAEPQRLSDVINTDQDEDAPFIASDGVTLYFSSKGHDNMGGYDVFMTKYNPAARSWSRPVNMGHPINSAGDDIFFSINDSTQISYVSSNRQGSLGREDIFSVKPLERVLIKGKVIAQASGKPVPNCTIDFKSLRNSDVDQTTISSASGIYGVKVSSKHRYSVTVMRQGEIMLTTEIDVPLADEPNTEIEKNFELDIPVEQIEEMVVRKMVVQNVKLVKLNYQEYDTLVINGVVRDGNTPIANVQVKLRESTVAEALYSTTSDQQGHYHFAFIPGKKENYVVDFSQSGYQPNSIAVVHSDKEDKKSTSATTKKNVNTIEMGALMVKLEVGSKSVLGGVYFGFNSSELTLESNVVLDKLHGFLTENPMVVMEVGGFTDNVGDTYVNRIVAQKRSQAVVNYLLAKGLEPTRIQAKGYGEEQPIAPNDTEENGRDVNRRIEIKIIAIKKQ